ncbi:MAG: ABC transporter ATP-binding protein [Deltaproteobacteria bacterium]|jgi:branched-chain amino acid transport system ATP-binding protein|uniref:ABC transporter domain-containing protein n=1 Tax=marine metagenome TaxID=408172 RepID=A0A381TEM6_9ZZZZ|nr:ABC transporter ATP-binding protein [Deltaproteobacteria bacterium]MDG1178011.1 ABC transporter ATP-binding protein [SAR324 cluster bacterium]MAF54725.1 ABC transporter ATP-binding protein [Deltaproteobacteria bacterium]MDG1487845.1 ABC transporter ATP-binding protein [SAR324 cluster bacterium]MDP6210814.1 ABC transporter ATP-binding protein [SAR324 cluster bacterium]|tara:strand:+ start:572 stop:1318 length:747 start_codon:yes stop_codon:yes gene_type:complete
MLKVNSLVKSFGGLLATDNLSFEVEAGKLHAVIGPNGAGKTTLISQITGETKPDSGTVIFDGDDISDVPVHLRSARGLARSFQITNIFPDMTTWDNVALAVQAQAGHSFHFWKDARKDPLLREPALVFLEQVGLAKRAGIVAGQLSHGEHRQLEIAMALATRPKMLLLDEPMAGMGPEESKAMVDILQGLKRKLTILLIEHDMDVVFTLADQITVLVYGRGIATDAPEAIRNHPEVQAAYLGEEEVSA